MIVALIDELEKCCVRVTCEDAIDTSALNSGYLQRIAAEKIKYAISFR